MDTVNELTNKMLAEAAGIKVDEILYGGKVLSYVNWRQDENGKQVAWVIPDYLHDANAALTLWDLIPVDYTPRLVRMVYPRNGKVGYIFKGNIMHNLGEIDIEVEADTPAEAICRAFWAWHASHAQEGA